jgi:formylmethanofuran dehydrogenase subunit E
MSQLVYSTMSSRYSSTQAYLGTVAVCPECGGQKNKNLFKMVDGQQLCKDCQEGQEELKLMELEHV